ncbi:4517_t:CDS:2, partial [Racocetra persica]
PGSSGITILLGMEFDDPEVTLLAEQVQRMTVGAEHEVPQNKQEKKLNQLYLEAVQREINQFREQVIGKDNTKKDKKGKAKSLNITFNQQEGSKVKIPKIDLVKDLEEEYGYATNQALNLDRKDFEAMQEYEQQILMERFARQIELCRSELLRKQYQEKYKKLLGVSLENLDKMHNIEDEEELMFKEQQRARIITTKTSIS